MFNIIAKYQVSVQSGMIALWLYSHSIMFVSLNTVFIHSLIRKYIDNHINWRDSLKSSRVFFNSFDIFFMNGPATWQLVVFYFFFYYLIDVWHLACFMRNSLQSIAYVRAVNLSWWWTIDLYFGLPQWKESRKADHLIEVDRIKANDKDLSILHFSCSVIFITFKVYSIDSESRWMRHLHITSQCRKQFYYININKWKSKHNPIINIIFQDSKTQVTSKDLKTNRPIQTTL